MSVETKVLPKHAGTPDRARHQRGCARHRSPQNEDKGVLEIARSKKAGRDALCALEDPSWLRARAPQGPFRRPRRVPSRRHRAKPQDHGPPADRAAAPTSAGVRCVNGVSIGCRAVQPGTVIDRKPNATIEPQKHSQAPKPNGFFDSIDPRRTSGRHVLSRPIQPRWLVMHLAPNRLTTRWQTARTRRSA